MRKLSTLLAALVMVAFLAPTSFAQVGLEEGTALIPRRQDKQEGMLVFSSAVDTINATANDTTGVMYVAGYTYTDPNIVYTVASGGTVSIKVVQQVAPTFEGPWYTLAENDTISATGSAAIAIAESSDYRLPYHRLILDGIGANAATTNFTYLYIVFVKDDDKKEP